MKTTLLAILCGVLVTSAAAVDPADVTRQPFKLTINSGDTYYNCRVVKVAPDTVTIMHEQGVTKIGLELLSPDLQKQFNYDPIKAREYARAEQEKREQEMARVRSLKEKRDREEQALMAGLMAAEKKQLLDEAERQRAGLEASQTAAAPNQPLAPMPGDPTPMLGSATPTAPIMQTEVLVPATTPISQIYTPGTTQSQRYLFRDYGYYYPWYTSYGYGYTYPYYSSGGHYYGRPSPHCPPFFQQPRRPIVSGTIKVGNGYLQINR